MIALALALTVANADAHANAAGAGVNAWALVERGAASAAAVDPSPLFSRVQSQERHADPLLDEDISGSLDAVRAYGPALDALDAAVATPSCTLPRDIDPPSVLRLADAALVTALADAADKHPGRAVADVGRAGDLAALVARCKKPSLSSAEVVIGIGEHARPIAWFLAEQRLVDAAGLARIDASLAQSSTSAMYERALDGEHTRLGHSFTLDEQHGIDELGKRLDAAMRDMSALKEAAADFEHIARPEHVVVVKCDATSDATRYTVSRAVAHALERRAADALGNDTVVGPSLDGSGVLVVSAGPVARSCGFSDGDLVVEVNGISMSRVDQAVVDAPNQVAHDGFASFRVLRRGNAVTWRVEVEKPATTTTASGK
jgi:hypothetical protein